MSKSKKNPLLTALRVIESIVNDDFCEDLSMRLHDPEKPLRGDRAIMAHKLLQIYTFAHASDKRHVCYSVHKDWRKQLAKAAKEMAPNAAH